ncbi:MAG: hypothetical protein PHF56_18270 [Desulfuromonadaceae bacterium]|nr:hypothetical protein [Desulfuromonadaceae bacterium]
MGSIKNGQDIHSHIDTENVRKAIIAGSGYIGLEMAEALMIN